MNTKFFVTVFFAFLMINAAQSQRMITVRVLDLETSDPIDNAQVYKKGHSTVNHTNALGYFMIEADVNDNLIIVKEGYVTARIDIPEQNNFVIKVEKNQKDKTKRVEESIQRGYLTKGIKTGVWEYFDKKEELALLVDYDAGEILYQSKDTSEYAILIDGEYKMMKVDRAPRYIGSFIELYKIMCDHNDYPSAARKNKTTGTLMLMFEVDTLGQVVNNQILNDIGDGCGESVLAAFKKVPNLWIPAMQNGQTYNSRFMIPVSFYLLEKDEEFVPDKSLEEATSPIYRNLSPIRVVARKVSTTISSMNYIGP